MRISFRVFALSLACVLAAHLAVAADRLMPSGHVTEVTVENVSESGGTVTGTVVNRGTGTLRNVRVLIRYEWLWNDERNPGTDNPGFAVYHVIPDEVPAGRSITFSYTPVTSLPMRDDGRFHAEARISGFTRVTTSVQHPGAPTT